MRVKPHVKAALIFVGVGEGVEISHTQWCSVSTPSSVLGSHSKQCLEIKIESATCEATLYPCIISPSPALEFLKEVALAVYRGLLSTYVRGRVSLCQETY